MNALSALVGGLVGLSLGLVLSFLFWSVFPGITENVFVSEVIMPNVPKSLKTRSSLDTERIQYIDAESDQRLFSSSCGDVQTFEKMKDKYRVVFFKSGHAEMPILNCLIFYYENVQLNSFVNHGEGVHEIVLIRVHAD